LCHAAADSDARCPTEHCGTADMAIVALSNWPRDSGALRDGTTVCQSPPRGTGHLNLQENSSEEGKSRT